VQARAVWVVDEAGELLFGNTPAKVQVTNLTASQVLGEPVSFRSTAAVLGPSTDPTVTVATVPADHAFLMTDIEGTYVCCNGDLPCALSDSTGIRLTWRWLSTAAVSPPSPGQRSYTTGILFNPGQTISLGLAITPVQCSGVHGGDITLMGRLVPVS
jgi:hypothetical protein